MDAIDVNLIKKGCAFTNSNLNMNHTVICTKNPLNLFPVQSEFAIFFSSYFSLAHSKAHKCQSKGGYIKNTNRSPWKWNDSKKTTQKYCKQKSLHMNHI